MKWLMFTGKSSKNSIVRGWCYNYQARAKPINTGNKYKLALIKLVYVVINGYLSHIMGT